MTRRRIQQQRAPSGNRPEPMPGLRLQESRAPSNKRARNNFQLGTDEAVSEAARAVLDDLTVAAMRTTIGLTPIAVLPDATAQYSFVARVSSGAGEWEEMTQAQAQAAIGVGTRSVITKSTTYTTTADDDVILCNAEFTVTLHSPSSGDSLAIKNVGSDTVTIDGGGNGIDGDGEIYLATQYDAVELISDGSNWWIT